MNKILFIAAFASLTLTVNPKTKPAPATKPAIVAKQQRPKPAPAPVAKQQRPIVLMRAKEREIVPPHTVGVGNDCPFPTVKEPIRFICPKCGLRGQTHVLYPHLPWCPKDNAVMIEIED